MKKRAKRIILSIILLVILIIVNFVYILIPYPIGFDYRYEYSLNVTIESGSVDLIVPIPITKGGQILKHLNYEDSGIDLEDVIETDHGLGLSINRSNSFSIYLDGTYKASRKLVGFREDSIPVLSMSTLNHTYIKFPPSQSMMVYSSQGNVTLELIFNAVHSKMKSWSIVRYHIRGGGGNHFSSESELDQGWGIYPVDASDIDVD